MNRQSVTVVLTGVVVGVASLWVAASLSAQSRGGASGGTRIAVVDVVRVFNEYQRQKDLTEEMNDLEGRLRAENQQRLTRIETMKAELDRLNLDDPTYATRARELVQVQIEYEVWAKAKQADMAREVGLWTDKIYREILKAAEELAKRDGYDIVLYRGQYQGGTLDPEGLKEQIRSNQVLYAAPSVDITVTLSDKLNADYRTQPRSKMMWMP